MDHPSNVTTLPIRRRVPDRPSSKRPASDSVRLGYDFGFWCVELFAGETFRRRHSSVDHAFALAEVERLEAEGLRRLPPSQDAVAKGAKS